jgi:Uma2 family endonuclease
MEGRTVDDRARGGKPHRFTVADYHRMAEAGILGEDSQVELIRGLIVDKAPKSAPHSGMVNRLTRLLSPVFGLRGTLSVQNPVQLDDNSEPEPDVAILKFRADYYRSAIPRADDVLVVIEVADTSLQNDRDAKVPLYAESGVPECWLVNLLDRVVEVYREPIEGSYSRCQSIGPDRVLNIVALPGLALISEDLWEP